MSAIGLLQRLLVAATRMSGSKGMPASGNQADAIGLPVGKKSQLQEVRSFLRYLSAAISYLS